MAITTLFFDVDDTLYPSTSGIWELVRQRMHSYMTERLHISPAEADRMRAEFRRTYGTTLRGLQATCEVDTADYLAYVHDVPVEERLAPDPALQAMLAGLPQRKILFTNADAAHAKRVVAALGIAKYFHGLVDIHDLAPFCKPAPEAYSTALHRSGENDPRRCLFLDDSLANLAPARALGMTTVWVGGHEPGGHAVPHPPATWSIPSVLELPAVLAQVNVNKERV